MTDLLDAAEADFAAGTVRGRPESLLLRRVGLTIVLACEMPMAVDSVLVPFVEKFCTPLGVNGKSNFGSVVWLWWMSVDDGVSGVCLGGPKGGGVAFCSGLWVGVEEEEQEKAPF